MRTVPQIAPINDRHSFSYTIRKRIRCVRTLVYREIFILFIVYEKKKSRLDAPNVSEG